MGPVFPFGQMSLNPELEVSVEKINSKIHCFGLAFHQTPRFQGGLEQERVRSNNESCPRVNLRCSLHGRVGATCFCSEEKKEGVETRLLIPLCRREKLHPRSLTGHKDKNQSRLLIFTAGCKRSRLQSQGDDSGSQQRGQAPRSSHRELQSLRIEPLEAALKHSWGKEGPRTGRGGYNKYSISDDLPWTAYILTAVKWE